MYKKEKMEEQQRIQSEFNYAVSFLNRINVLFYTCDDAAMRLKSSDWFHSLLALRRELSDDMTEKELTKSNKYRDDLHPMIALNSRNSALSGTEDIDQELYTKLDEFELFLRKVLRRAGYKTKFSDDPSRALR
jgi:hypothetical protein